MIDYLLFAFFLFIPAGFANMTPVLASRLPVLKKFNYPIDFGMKLGGIRIFGDHKTIRGFLSGIVVAIFFVYLQTILYEKSLFIQDFSLVDYSEINIFIFGGLLGFGALFGDAVKSFAKRRVGVQPGKSWFPFDQIDYILGGLLFISFYQVFPLGVYLSVLLVWFGLHIIITYIGYLVGVRKDPI